jgi:hypothetical protein
MRKGLNVTAAQDYLFPGIGLNGQLLAVDGVNMQHQREEQTCD